MANKVTTKAAIRHVMAKANIRAALTAQQVNSLINNTYKVQLKYNTVRRVLSRLTNEEKNVNQWIARVGENQYVYTEKSAPLDCIFENTKTQKDKKKNSLKKFSNQELINELQRRLG